MKILVMGASGTGTRTLASAIASNSGYTHLDADEFYWEKSDQPYTVKVNPEVRRTNLRNEFEKNENVVVSGSLVSWGEFWITAFDLIVFLTLDPLLRMERLRQREYDRFGEALNTDPKRIETSKAFLDWAQKYDDPTFKGRSITVQKAWLDEVDTEILELDSSGSVEGLKILVRKALIDKKDRF